MDTLILTILILLPALAGLALPVFKIKNRTAKLCMLMAAMLITAAANVYMAGRTGYEAELFSITDALTIGFRVDGMSVLFSLIASFGWICAGAFSFVYMKHEESEDRFFCFFMLVETTLMGMDFASNAVTMYVFYELLTLMSVPLVLHNLSREAVAAGLKFLFYSVAGGFLGLWAIFVLQRYTLTLDFVAGGSLDMSLVSGHEQLILISVFLGILGFGAKAGLYPLHGWLPTAHPVAPAPASAVLSAIIAKAGVLAIFRMIFCVVGTDFLKGTWCQYTLLGISLMTVFMGSMMAYRENILKKRLAYSTVSQISYVLSGAFLLTAGGALGALAHVVFHAAIKTCLFLCAGAIIFATGKTKVDELRGIGREMPITVWSFTLASLGLIGIPPFNGFVSKWYLASASLESGLSVFSWLMPVVLLVSALLTAGYLLPVTVRGFFPGKDYLPSGGKPEKNILLWLTPLLLALFVLTTGICTGGLMDWLSDIVGSVM